MSMKNPPHPGRQVRTAIEACNLTIKKTADHIGVSRTKLSRIINGHTGISPNMAIRLEKAFGGSADVFIKMQVAYDLAKAREHEQEIEVSKYEIVN